jgi:sulfatase maturation enzyme AslB (radical SAM superfamily)
MRNYRGYDYNGGYPLCELSVEDFRRILTPEILKSITQPDPPINGRASISYGFRGVLFNGNLGDFSNAQDAAEIVKYLAEHNVPVMINTNGSTRSPAWWASLALPGVSIGFALDGLEDTHSLYRQDTDWNRVIENAKAFIAAGGKAVWRFIPFDHNRHQENTCRDLAKQMGFAKFKNIYDGRDTGPVFSRDGKFSHQIGHDPNYPTHTPNAKDLLHNHVTWFDHKKIKIEKDQPKLEINCMHKQNKEIYVAADGTVYPCCFLGFYPATMHHPGNEQLRSLVAENNALEHSLEHCMSWFEKVQQTWGEPSIAQGRLYQCVNTCGKN